MSASAVCEESIPAKQLPRNVRSYELVICGVTLVSAFLLFQVQPLIGKFILPWFGGSAAVWTTCMLFFQFVLFTGYLYAHLTVRFCPLRAQVVLHCILLTRYIFLSESVFHESQTCGL